MKGIFYLLLCSLALPAAAQNRYYPYADGNKWGFTDENLAVLTAPQFDTSFRFVDNKFAIVQKQRLYGLLSPNGSLILPCSYEHLTYFGMNAGIAKQKGKYQLLNFSNGQPLSAFMFDRLDDYIYHDGITLLVTQAGKKYFLDVNSGHPLNKTGYDDAVFMRDFNRYGKIKIAGKCGLIDMRGAVVLPARYDELYTDWQQGKKVLVAVSGKTVTWFDEQGKVVPQPRKEKHAPNDEPMEETAVAMPVTEEIFAMPMEAARDEADMKKDVYVYSQGSSKWKVTLENRPRYTSGETEILHTFELNGYTNLQKLNYDPFSRDIPAITLKAVKDGKAGIIDPAGKVLAPFRYDDIIYTGNFYKTLRNNRIGMLSRDLTEIIPPVLQQIYSSDSYLRAWLVEMPDGKRGYMDMKSGKIFIPGIQLTSN
ncbi:MAG TPA: WG repeat-containing protein [Chitinophaga sp.]|uniref:WG repeat-containing protein n=1 Tax=Chitinophaga sp. TaxID=1869181 RepID=UPI002DBF37D1|nr:WG repeat-containing protein [Chitinophaga sp.]HEU4552399.1 WG repeat-containing protein [Chitinophaga sp.]